MIRPHRPFHRRASAHQQRGVALWVVTVLALLVGLIAMSQVTSLMGLFRTARDERDLGLARQAAEAALRDAEADIACMQWDTTAGAWKQVTAPTTTNTYCVSFAPHCSQLMPTSDVPGIRVLGQNPSSAPPAVNWTLAPAACTDGNCAMEFGAKTAVPAITGVAKQPRYQVDVFDASTDGTSQPVPLFRITARGYGGNANTVSELQEVYRPCR